MPKISRGYSFLGLAIVAIGLILVAAWWLKGGQEPAFGQKAPELAKKFKQAMDDGLAGRGPAGFALHAEGSEPQWAVCGVVVRCDDPRFRIRVTVGDQVLGNQTVPEMVERMNGPTETGYAAINGDFFDNKEKWKCQGSMRGLAICDGQLISGPMSPTFWMDKDGKPVVGSVIGDFSITWPSGKKTAFGLNCATKDFESGVRTARVVVFTPVFGEHAITEPGRDYVLEVGPGDLPIRAGATVNAKVRKVSSTGNTPIPRDAMVLTIANKVPERKEIPELKPGDEVELRFGCTPTMQGVETAVGGEPVLVNAGKAIAKLDNDARAPRSAVGVLPGGELVLFVVDGRQPGHSIGMTRKELADWMEMIGCEQALNLDGGGSSTLWWEGKVLNKPSDGELRKVGNALVVMKKIPGK